MISIIFAACFTFTAFTETNSAALTITDFSADDIRYANCKMQADNINTFVEGTIDFRQIQRYDTEVLVNVGGLTGGLGAKHGFHVHTYGDMTNGCTSTGGHFNPSGDPHAAPYQRDRHAGDFGNLIADAAGNNYTLFTDQKAMLVNNRRRILGRAVVIHAGEDDLGLGGFENSLTNGNAGPRIGCCVIGIANGDAWTGIDPSL